MRWLHIYVSLLGFTSLVFFSVTGITLNHPEWFGTSAERVVEHEGNLSLSWLGSSSQTTASETPETDSASADISSGVAKLEIVEHFRKTHRIRGAVSEFRIDDAECLILFKGPGYSADATINRETGRYTITETAMGVIAIINDLHKGRDSGPVWFWIIDITAALMVFVSVTGIILILYLKKKRWSGVITAVVGTILFGLVYLFIP